MAEYIAKGDHHFHRLLLETTLRESGSFRPVSRFTPIPVRSGRFAPIPFRPGSFRPALKNEIWKIIANIRILDVVRFVHG
jgi:hypothetical protein